MNKSTQIEKVVIINNVNDILTVSSTQIAEHFGKRHTHVLDTIKKLIAENSAVTSMFIESTYQAGTGKSYKYYECTRDGFSLLVMGFTGKEALNWKLKYIDAFNKMENVIKNGNTAALDEFKAKRLEIMMINAKARLMKEQNKRIELMIKNPEYTPTEDLPPIVPKTYTATEVATMLGVTANRIGRLSNANGLKDKAYGEWYKEPLANGKEVESFRYNENGVNKLRELLKD